jgi:hypothetical protein
MTPKLVWLMVLALPMVVCAWARQDEGAAYEVKLGNEAYAKFDNHTALQHFLQALKSVAGITILRRWIGS